MSALLVNAAEIGYPFRKEGNILYTAHKHNLNLDSEGKL